MKLGNEKQEQYLLKLKKETVNLLKLIKMFGIILIFQLVIHFFSHSNQIMTLIFLKLFIASFIAFLIISVIIKIKEHIKKKNKKI